MDFRELYRCVFQRHLTVLGLDLARTDQTLTLLIRLVGGFFPPLPIPRLRSNSWDETTF